MGSSGVVVKRTWASLVLGLVAIGFCGGCGGGGEESSATSAGTAVPLARVIARADANCAKGNQRIGRLRTPPLDPAHATPAQLRSVAPYLRQVTAIIASEVDGAAAAGKPDEKAARFATAIEDSRRLVEAMERQASAAAQGNPAAFRKASEEIDANPAGRELAALGFKVCGRG